MRSVRRKTRENQQTLSGTGGTVDSPVECVVFHVVRLWRRRSLYECMVALFVCERSHPGQQKRHSLNLVQARVSDRCSARAVPHNHGSATSKVLSLLQEQAFSKESILPRRPRSEDSNLRDWQEESSVR